MMSLKTPVERWIYEALQSGILKTSFETTISSDHRRQVVNYQEKDAGRFFVATIELADEIRRETKKEVTWNQVADLLKHLGFERVTTKRPTGWIFPALPEARRLWNERMGCVQGLWEDETEDAAWTVRDTTDFC